MNDESYMSMALELARSAQGQTSPNPMVGAVVVKNGRVVGLGAHLKAGTEHAEVHALRMAGAEAIDAAIYVTLEPCSHYGKTPPCADLIIKSGIKRVIIASEDANPLVAGKGIAKLIDAGIEVKEGVMSEEADSLNRPFFYYIKHNRPYVTAKLAMSLDGKVRTSAGESKWITGPEARKDGHMLRHMNDVILVGIETILADDPLLTVRAYESENHPVRVILDHHLRTPLEANVITNKETLTWIFTLEKNRNSEKAVSLQQKGIKLTYLESAPLSILNVLDIIAAEGLMTVLIEGGPTIQDAFFRAGAVNEIISYIAPKVIGGSKAFTAVEGQGTASLNELKPCHFTEMTMVGHDIKLTAYYEVM